MRLQKIMLNAGFTCPNRDGSLGVGGCTFCRTDSFNPSYCHGSIKEQLEAGKRFFAGKYKEMRYLAYFQAYTNTYASFEEIKQKYEEALAVPEVVGLVIGTRPDCISEETLSYLEELQSKGWIISIEIGVESLFDRTLSRVNRGHDSRTSTEAIERCHKHRLPVCIHLIFGLPGETEDDILSEAEIINQMPITSLKIHQLQILKGTVMEEEWKRYPEEFLHLSVSEYAKLVASFIKKLRTDIMVERFASSAPPSLVIAPNWNLKPSEVQKIIEEEEKI